MAVTNDIKTLTFIAREMLRQVKNNLQFIKNLSGENLTSRFTQTPKAGETISIRKPTRYVGRTGETYSAEAYTERTIPVTVQTTDGVDITLTNRELMFSLEQIAERVVAPVAPTLANNIEAKALALAYKAVANTVGTPATIPTALKTYNQARAKMAWEGTPSDNNHNVLMTPDMSVEIVDATKGLFHSSTEVEKGYRDGLMGYHAGAKWYECQNLPTHTVGPLGGASPKTNGATQTGASIITDGWTAGAAKRLNAGDVITFSGVYAVNPWTRKSTGSLRQFVVTEDFSSDGGGAGTIKISPSVVATGAFQNVTNSIADNSDIVVLGAAAAVSPVGLRFHKEAFIFGSIEQPDVSGAVQFCKVVTDPQTGISIRFIRDWDTANNQQLNRFDCVWAWGVAFPEFACRIQS